MRYKFFILIPRGRLGRRPRRRIGRLRRRESRRCLRFLGLPRLPVADRAVLGNLAMGRSFGRLIAKSTDALRENRVQVVPPVVITPPAGVATTSGIGAPIAPPRTADRQTPRHSRAGPGAVALPAIAAPADHDHTAAHRADEDTEVVSYEGLLPARAGQAARSKRQSSRCCDFQDRGAFVEKARAGDN
jgi:hypothetical protein